MVTAVTILYSLVSGVILYGSYFELYAGATGDFYSSGWTGIVMIAIGGLLGVWSGQFRTVMIVALGPAVAALTVSIGGYDPAASDGEAALSIVRLVIRSALVALPVLAGIALRHLLNAPRRWTCH